MNSKAHLDVAPDTSGKLLRLSFAGEVNGADMQPYLAAVETALQGLRPGFFLLTDLSGLRSMDLSCVPHIQKTMNLLREHGVGRVVRIIPSPDQDIGFNLMSLFHYPRGVRTVTCENPAQAEQALK